MSRIKFNHVFACLLLVSVVSAFVLPRKTSGIRSSVQGMFYPVAKPARMIAAAARGPFGQPKDKRPEKDVVAENVRLRAAVASLTGQLEHLQQIQADRARFGSIGQFCLPVPVMGSDPGSRDSLSIQGTFAATLVGQPALYVGGLAGTIERAGLSGAQVRLVTDRSFSAIGRIGTFGDDGAGGTKFQPKEITPAYVEGRGNGVMMISNIKFDELQLAKVTEGMVVALHDKDFPDLLKNQPLGQIVSIRRRPDAPHWADIELRPAWNLQALQEVMVLKREDSSTALTNAQ